MKRRELLTSGAIGGVLGAIAAPADAAAAQSGAGSADQRAIERVADMLDQLRSELREQHRFGEIEPIRSAQKSYLRSNAKLPDFIDVGMDVWFQIYDWHVRWQQPIAQSRDAQGRLTLAMNQTLIVLRPEVAGNYIGLPYDAR
jgi:hypothetical protein